METTTGKRRNQPQEEHAGGGERGPRTTVVSVLLLLFMLVPTDCLVTIYHIVVCGVDFIFSWRFYILYSLVHVWDKSIGRHNL